MRYNESGKPIPENLADLELMNEDWLTPEQAAPVLNTTQQTLLAAAKTNPSSLGIPVLVLKSRVKVPRLALIHFMKYGNAKTS